MASTATPQGWYGNNGDDRLFGAGATMTLRPGDDQLHLLLLSLGCHAITSTLIAGSAEAAFVPRDDLRFVRGRVEAVASRASAVHGRATARASRFRLSREGGAADHDSRRSRVVHCESRTGDGTDACSRAEASVIFSFDAR
jgi:hypothetical protein